MRLLAILAVRNEIRYMESCLAHLVGQGAFVHVIDNESTDGTLEAAERWLGHGVSAIDHQPWTGAFELREQLRLKEVVARTVPADWYLHLDADERREAPRPFATLVDGLIEVDRLGFNSVDFDEFVFIPTADDPSFDSADFESRMRWYYHYEPASPDRLRINAWKRTDDVDLVGLGGHHVRFPGQRVFPRPFIMRHYPVLGVEHATEKYGQRIFSPSELADSWHGDRAAFPGRSLVFPSRSRLKVASTDTPLDSSNAWDRHPFLDTKAGPVIRRVANDPRRSQRSETLRMYADRHRAYIPAIAAVAVDELRPLWSVMMPVRNPQPDQLTEALRSILAQDCGAATMQIGVVDDAPSGEVARLVREVSDDRIEYHPNDSPRGLAGNWNRCLELSRGHLIHLLHQDDRVVAGFYDRLGRPLADQPELVGAFCRVSGFNERGTVTWTQTAERPDAGVIDGLDVSEAETHRMIVAGVVARRSVYEEIGGYRTDLPYCTDWDFCKRLAVLGPVWYDPLVLAHWRQHSAQESERLAATGADLADRRRSIELTMAFLPVEAHKRVREGALRSSITWAVEKLRDQIEMGAHDSALAQARTIVSSLEERATGASPLRASDSAAELVAAQRRIETLEAQVLGWAAAVRLAQSRIHRSDTYQPSTLTEIRP